MTEIFESEFFTGNRHRLQEITSSNLILLPANGMLQRSADTTFPFRQDSNFWYMTGINEPDFLLVISASDTFLIAPKRASHRDLWDGSLDKNSIKFVSGIDIVHEHHEGWILLDKLLKKYKKVHTVNPAETYVDHAGFYTNPARAVLLEALKKHRSLEIVDIRKKIARMRQIKQSPEIKAIKTAVSITSEALNGISSKKHEYSNEAEVAAELTKAFMLKGGNGHAYQPIVASGMNATTIHYVNNNHSLKQNELMLIDAGAEFSNYSSDISRTYATGTPTKRQQQVYESVLRIWEKAAGMLKPGADMKKYEEEVDKLMGKELVKLKLIDDPENKKKLKKYYPHLTSHFLGLDTHDAADYTLPLSPGMVLTVEPGIYIPEEGIGIRIEDDVLITESGVEILSDGLSRELS